MSILQTLAALASQSWVDRLGWALVHFVWQGAALAGLYAVARRFARNTRANTHYALACATLAMMLTSPVVTWSLMHPTAATPQPNHPAHRSAVAKSMADGFTVPAPPPLPGGDRSGGDKASVRFLPVVVGVWMAGILFCWLRLAGGWVMAAEWRSRRVRPASAEWQARLRQLAARLRVTRPVRLLVSGTLRVPAVAGFLRPIVFLPAAVLAGLPPEHIEAFLAHELAHIRRLDYLANALQVLVEALLFYHPAVWWVSSEVRLYREMCCDDLAVSVNGDVLAYASALAELAGCAPADYFAPALAASGASLSRRIGRLFGEPRPALRVSPGPGAIAGILMLAVTGILLGQSDEPAPRFDVASIKPIDNSGSTPLLRGMRPLSNGRLTATNAPLRMLIRSAYGVQNYQIIGGPDWMDSAGFDIEAKGDPSANPARALLMLRSLLEDRFQLRYHKEQRDLPVYALTAGKNGPKLPAPKAGGCVAPDPNQRGPVIPAPGQAAQVICGAPNIIGLPSGGFKMSGGEITMKQFVQVLQTILGRPVADRTGLTGPFDISLQFVRDDVTAGLPAPGALPPGPGAPAVSDGPEVRLPSIIDALEEQLGLKLAAGKGPVEVMVIDRVEHPTAN